MPTPRVEPFTAPHRPSSKSGHGLYSRGISSWIYRSFHDAARLGSGRHGRTTATCATRDLDQLVTRADLRPYTHARSARRKSSDCLRSHFRRMGFISPLANCLCDHSQMVFHPGTDARASSSATGHPLQLSFRRVGHVVVYSTFLGMACFRPNPATVSDLETRIPSSKPAYSRG